MDNDRLRKTAGHEIEYILESRPSLCNFEYYILFKWSTEELHTVINGN